MHKKKKSRSYDVCLLTICSACTDIIFLFFALLAHYWAQKLKFGKIVKKLWEILSFYTCVPSIKIIRCMVPEIWNSIDKIFFVILGNFNTLKNENIKREKTPGDIIILHNCTKNHDHMLYYSWDMARVACNCYFSFWAIFSPFIPLTAQKIKISHTKKKHLEVL